MTNPRDILLIVGHGSHMLKAAIETLGRRQPQPREITVEEVERRVQKQLAEPEIDAYPHALRRPRSKDWETRKYQRSRRKRR